jgi:Protein of unknown function (DUF2914)
MMRRVLGVAMVVGLLAMALPAFAEGGSAEVKAAKSVVKHEAVDPQTEFAAGDTVLVWSKIMGEKDKTVTHVWKREGKEVWRMDHAVKNASYRTYSKKRSIKAGAWTVEVVDDAGAKLGEISFTVK